MRKKVAIVGPSLQMGGIERACTNTANGLSERGLDVLFLAIFRHEHFFTLRDEIKFREPPVGQNEVKLDLWKTIKRIRKELTFYGPDTVLAYNKFYAALTLVALIGKKIPIFISDRASPLYRWKWEIELFMKLVYNVFPPRGAMAQTSIAAEYQKTYFPAKTLIRVIPNAIRQIIHYPEMKRQNILLGVGRLNDRLKGFDRLIEAFSLIENSNWKLVFAGSKHDSEYLEELVAALNLEDRVEFLGKVKNIDLIYAKAGIFVIPSRSEGFPNALCEAMAAGVACISFDFTAGPRDIITHGYDGIIVRNNDVEALASAIDNLIVNEQERFRLGKNARKIYKKLNSDIITQHITNFIFSFTN